MAVLFGKVTDRPKAIEPERRLEGVKRRVLKAGEGVEE